ncbi:MAG: hypothetical protein WA964_19750 [Ilumatobacter sp.]|uniref:hypothetical protein n=1 Tax=Ilumatobacter sp. TaxID=1967498 RepID=UPI003C71F1DA
MTSLIPPTPGTATTALPAALAAFANGRSVGIGSLPHRDPAAAAAFAIAEFDIATVPTLPTRSPAEGMVAQAIAGLPGVSLGQYGSFAIDPVGLTVDVPITTGLGTDAFAGLGAFLDLAAKINLDGQPIKWQFVGPVTLGIALQRAGLRNAQAFTIAANAVRHHVSQIAEALSDALPNSPQLMLLDEPWMTELMSPEFPIPPDIAVDLVSTGMAAVGSNVAVGIHCCGTADIATMLETGPQVLSIPLSDDLAEYAGYLGRFLDGGGVVAWGALPTTGPITVRVDRYWKRLSDVWCQLVERGVDAGRIRRQSLITPECGLAHHQVSSARKVARLASELGHKVSTQATSSKLALGA